MLSKSALSRIKSLAHKKYRKEHNACIVEGEKVVSELFSSNIPIEAIYATKQYTPPKGVSVNIVTDRELASLSQLTTPSPVLAIARIPPPAEPTIHTTGITLVLDSLRDPGNMGTILRLADWFAVQAVYASPDSVDIWNPKVIQSSMGSVFRVPFATADLSKLLTQYSHMSIFAATLAGDSLYQVPLPSSAVLCIGSESHGLSDEVLKHTTHQLTIPRFGNAESLNAAVATGILLSHFHSSMSS